MRLLLIALVLLLLVSCSAFHTDKGYRKEFHAHIQKQECELAQRTIPLEQDDTKYLRFYKGTLGYTASLSILPATMVLDILLLGRCQYGCPIEENEKTVTELLFPTTSFTYEYTKELRCPDNSYYIQRFIEVGECYEKRGDLKSLESGHAQIDFLSKAYHQTPTCIQNKDGQTIDRVKERIEAKL